MTLPQTPTTTFYGDAIPRTIHDTVKQLFPSSKVSVQTKLIFRQTSMLTLPISIHQTDFQSPQIFQGPSWKQASPINMHQHHGFPYREAIFQFARENPWPYFQVRNDSAPPQVAMIQHPQQPSIKIKIIWHMLKPT